MSFIVSAAALLESPLTFRLRLLFHTGILSVLLLISPSACWSLESIVLILASVLLLRLRGGHPLPVPAACVHPHKRSSDRFLLPSSPVLS